MDNSAQTHSAMEMVKVYAADRVIDTVTREAARQMKAAGTHFFINHGRDLRVVQLSPEQQSQRKVDARGSREQSGCITARESALNAECDYSQSDVALLSQHYEHRLEQHILKGRKGTPRVCDVIAARVKTILSVPTVRVSRRRSDYDAIAVAPMIPFADEPFQENGL